MSNKIKALFNDKKGLTLVETLVALTILTLVLFCITPLFLSNLDTIKLSGDKAVKVYHNAGVMQKILANFETGDETANAGYDIDVASADITLTGNGITLDKITAQGDLLVSDPTDISAGYATVMADSPDSNFQVFPKTLTDDFKEAYLTVAAIGFSFVHNPAEDTSATYYKLFCNENGSETQLKYGDDYTMRRVESDDPTAQNRVIQIILYGGTKVNFSNSPLTFKYNNREVKIQVDAPSMIMVGEKSTDGYRYYVSRGETEKDSNGNDRLIVLERYMNDAPLTSAMNDVAWVSAEDADKYAVGADGEKYGYYVMCGDNGQIRRFWQNDTGNYYWGGDYTYYTDINHNRVDGNSYINATVPTGGEVDSETGMVRSTSVSYKFLARRGNPGNEGTDGYQLVHGTKASGGVGAQDPRENDAMAVSANMWTVTALDGSETSKNAYFYGSDGKMLYYYADNGGFTANNVGNGTFEDLKTNIIDRGSYKTGDVKHKILGTGYYNEWDYESLSWLHPDQDSYYKLYGIDKPATKEAAAAYPITLTSVGAIVLQGSNSIGDNNAYAGSTSSYNYDFFDGKTKIDPLLANYPTETYTLYCGYIPAAYDVWSRKAHYGCSLEVANEDDNANLLVAKKTKNNSPSTTDIVSQLDRKSNNILDSKTEKNPLWRGTFGVTPYLTSGESELIDTNAQLVYNGSSGNNRDYIYYWPYKNIDYAVSGKFFDGSTPESEYKHLFKLNTNPDLLINGIYSIRGLPGDIPRQQFLTGGKVMDITCSYFSHPFALHIAANPSIDDKAFMLDNEAGSDHYSYYYANRRETVTILRIASTKIPVPSSDKTETNDIAVSLAVGYAQGGSITFHETKGGFLNAGRAYPAFVNNIMPIGIVYLRAGTADIGKQVANGMTTNEYQAIDKTGFKLAEESNYFHQFYYLDSKLPDRYSNPNGDGSDNAEDEMNFLGSGIGAHIGNMYGAKYWQNNRHIVYRSTYGGQPDSNYHNTTPNNNYNYVRCHPMLDTKVTCVAWGTTWDNYPEAMWGTENGTVLSWFVNLNEAQKKTNNDREAEKLKAIWDDTRVEAEFQSYQWIDNVEGKAFRVKSHSWKSTVGAHTNEDAKDPSPASYPYSTSGKTISGTFRTFFDKSTQENKYYETKNYGFISTLSTINDIAYANDYWVAVGNQATGKQNLRGHTISPALYCGNGTLDNPNSAYYGGSQEIRAYTGDGTSGSWVNVRYWFDEDGTGKQAADNSTYLWKAVKISNNQNYNIVQINALNGVWYATGYEDSNQNGEWDTYERAIVCWARDPLAACDAYDGTGNPAEGRWSENTQFYRTTGAGQYQPMQADQVGGINSVACRDDM